MFCSLLLEKLEKLKIKTFHYDKWTEQTLEWKNKYDPVKSFYNEGKNVHPYVFMRILS